MAQKLILDDGILELDINGRGLLRFNASDFNLYQRFLTLVKELPGLEKEYAETVEQETGPEEGDELALAGVFMDKAKAQDRKLKDKLAWVFGPGNDFDLLLDGVNLMAFGRNGQRVITNLLNALLPYLDKGMQQHRKDEAAEAVAQANANRAQRRALS